MAEDIRSSRGGRPATSPGRRSHSLIYAADARKAPYDPGPESYPIFLNVEETLNHIAFGRLSAPRPEVPFSERWGSQVSGIVGDIERHPLVKRLERVIERVRRWQRQKRSSRYQKPLPALHPNDRAHLRWVIKNNGRNADAVLSALRSDVAVLQAEQKRASESISHARQTLCGALAAEKITAYGVPGIWPIRHNLGEREPVSHLFFDSKTLMLGDGWIRKYQKGWAEARFKADEVLKLWGTADAPPLPPEATTQQPAKKKRLSGLDFRRSDGKLVQKALAGLKAGTYRNPWDAAAALADDADGMASPVSKQKRLAAAINKALSTETTEGVQATEATQATQATQG